jgi:hypothetical protein
MRQLDDEVFSFLTMTMRDLDELHAAAIRDVVADLNRILTAAHADGLDVDLRVESLEREGGGMSRGEARFSGSPIIVATVNRGSSG